MTDALTTAREHLDARAREASETECSECGMRNPPSRPASACGMELLTHDGCPAAGGAFIPAVSPRGRRQCLGVAESDAVCEAVVALTAEVERLRSDLADAEALIARQGALLLATANALKGPPPALSAHSWHDLPEVAARLRADLAAAQPVLALDAIRRGPAALVCPDCGASWSSDVPTCPGCGRRDGAPDRDLCARCGKLALDHDCEAPR